MNIVSNLMVIGECLLDARRTKAFKYAINEVIRPGDVVLDVGTGSGILAMFAATLGAKRVYGVEIAHDIAKFAKQNIVANGFSDKIEIINADMKKFNFPHSVDVVIMELLDTGLVAEQEAVVFNWLHKNSIITSRTRLIPYRYICAFDLVQYDFSFYGIKMPFVIQARNYSVNRHIEKRLSKTVVYKDINFSQPIDIDVDINLNIEVLSSGILNALVLKSKTFLSKNHELWGTTDMNMPVIVPLKEQKVLKGEVIEIVIRYKMGMGFQNFFATIKKRRVFSLND